MLGIDLGNVPQDINLVVWGEPRRPSDGIDLDSDVFLA